jgi:hypothetical protein
LPGGCGAFIKEIALKVVVTTYDGTNPVRVLIHDPTSTSTSTTITITTTTAKDGS